MSGSTKGGSVAALVPAAGRGERLGPGSPKALRDLAGAPVLSHAVHALASSHLIDLIVIAAPDDEVESVRALIGSQEFPCDVSVVAGGSTRQDSVARALFFLPADVEIVLVHDAARPLVPAEVIERVIAAVRAGHEAVVPGLPVVDTIKRVDQDGNVTETVDRSTLRAIQTPQGFTRDVLIRAHAAADDLATDDAGLAERLGVPVHVVDGHEEALKVTRPNDLVIAEAIIAKRRAMGAST
jgi:2-C-methyl-D-erythritol 4-phosphate cytidylyltransferase